MNYNTLHLFGWVLLFATIFIYVLYMLIKEVKEHTGGYNLKDQQHYVRLKRLALHLRHGKLNPPNFSSHIIYDKSENKGSKLAQMPNLCSKWSWHPISGMPRLKRWQIGNIEVYFLNIESAARHYFGLSKKEYYHLFCGGYQDINSYGGVMLKNEATKYDHAYNIECFLKVKYFAITEPSFV